MLQPSRTRDSDADLMRRLGLGEEAALGDLLDRYWQPLVNYALRFVGDLDSAEDAVQEAYVRLWARRAVWVQGGGPRPYLYRIVRNLVLQDLEKRAVRTRWAQAQARDEVVGAGEVFEAYALRRDLETAIQGLPARRQEILVLARYGGLSYGEIAEVMGITPQTVANQMSAALRQLRESLATYEG